MKPKCQNSRFIMDGMKSHWESMVMQESISHQLPLQLLTAEEAALALRKSPQGFREAICRGKAPWAIWLREHRIKLGRRYLFRSTDIAKVQEHGDTVTLLDSAKVVSLHR